MGTLRSTSLDAKGHSYRGITLGEPIELDGDLSTYEWDHGAFPSGEVSLVEGELVVTVDVNDGP